MHILKKTLFWTLGLFFASSVLSVVAYRFLPVSITPLMVIRSIEQVQAGEKPRLYHEWQSFENISPQLSIAVVASEDQNFLKHHGFDIGAIEQAIEESEHGRRRRGASTISQQTAKNVFLWPSSTWLRKGLEAYFTVLIEALWPKQRILEVYLNSIEMGDGIYGAEAVAKKHFGTRARSLTEGQCALIAASLPNPRKFNSGAPSPYMLKRQRQITREMRHVRVWMREMLKK
ncbi:MAG: monofunctional biosynthetic peptidoglycan transglycosylase [Bacteroidaceae bacterium]|nr:monofunctional biosynthetic peptidoglycan transglycosylase [Bacteroidaceae bacterium]MBR7028700.1 monofunctional biosynthetic peptidoglycan transglycosylase [Bacteroidaceae bacterium]